MLINCKFDDKNYKDKLYYVGYPQNIVYSKNRKMILSRRFCLVMENPKSEFQITSHVR